MGFFVFNMATETAKRDPNRNIVVQGVTDDAFLFPTMLRQDPSTLRLKVDALISGGSSSGTEYTEGDVDASITGTAILWEDTSDTLRAVSAAKPLPVNIVAGGAGDGAILDGASASIKATVLDLTSSNPVTTAIVDSNGDQISSFGGGTQYATNAAYADGNTGTLALTIRDDALTTLTEADGDYSGLRVTSVGRLWTSTVLDTAIPAGNNNIGDVDVASIAAGNNNIGDVDIASIAAGNNNIGDVDVATIAAGDNNIGNVDIVTMPAVTNAGTFAVQVDGAALTALQLIDDVVFVDDTATHTTGTTKGVGIMAVATPSDAAVNANDIGMVAMSVNRELHVSLTTALPAGTNGIGKLTANSGVDIGDVDILSIAAGNNNIGDVDIASGTLTTLTTLTGGGIAHDSADSGNPHKIGYIAYSPDGTTPGTAVAELDRTNAKGDLDGRLFTNDEHPRSWSYHEDSSNALTDTSVQADPGDGFQIVITEIMFSTGAATACNIFFEEGSTKVLGPWYLEAVAGRGLFWKGKKHITASTAVTVTTSAAIAHSIDIQGYIQAV